MSNQRWAEDEIKAMLVNPIYTGLGPFPQIVSDEVWIATFIRVCKDVGIEQALSQMLSLLRESFAEVEE